MKKFMMIFCALMLFAGCANQSDAPKKEDPNYCDDSTCGLDTSADMTDYEGFKDENNAFMEISMDDAIEMFNEKQSGVIYFGFPKCTWCIEAIPILNEVAKTNKQHVYYVRTRDDNKELLYDDKQKEQLFKHISPYLKDDDKGEKKLFVPFVVSIKDGKVLKSHIGTVDGHNAKERKMSEEEKKQLQATYEDIMKSLKN